MYIVQHAIPVRQVGSIVLCILDTRVVSPLTANLGEGIPLPAHANLSQFSKRQPKPRATAYLTLVYGDSPR